MRFTKQWIVLPLILLGTAQVWGQNPTREQKVRGDRARIEEGGKWIYNDLEEGMKQAKESGKPLLVVLRCLPCEECVKLDDEIIDADARVQSLIDQFVRVRVVGTNGLDLRIFQYDTDQSFAVFMLNGDGTIYGRYGTRSDREHWEDDVSVDGMAAALEGALELHKGYPANRKQLAGKQSPKPSYERPELFPSLKEKYTSKINYEGDVVRSCIHCHQIGEAQREIYLSQDKPLPENVLFQYPHPKSIGLILDPKERGSVKRVVPGSIAAKSGLLGGDSIQSINAQPILSMADVQWVLHNTEGSQGELPLVVARGSQQVELKLKLTDGWRRLDTIEWRASTWMLRRRGLGGLKLESITEEERKRLGVSQSELALKVKHVGQYAPHDAAKRAGFKVGDILLSFDGQSDLVRETDVIAYSIGKFKKGDTIEMEVMRDGKKVTLKLQVT